MELIEYNEVEEKIIKDTQGYVFIDNIIDEYSGISEDTFNELMSFRRI
jgi:hypothetical protein